MNAGRQTVPDLGPFGAPGFCNHNLGFPDTGPGGELEFVGVSKAHPPGLPAGTELLEANLYAVIEVIAARAFPASSPGGTWRSAPGWRAASAPRSACHQSLSDSRDRFVANPIVPASSAPAIARAG
jgi:hypothetical protein